MKSVPNGRKFVASYVEFVHFMKRLHNDVSSHHSDANDPQVEEQHHFTIYDISR